MSKITYRELKGYKYATAKEFVLQLDLPRPLSRDLAVAGNWVVLSKTGVLAIKVGYCWDGPSGPTIDTPDFMRASLVHDSLYQLMRERELDNRTDRRWADALLKQLCREGGMSKSRSNYVYRAVRAFGGGAARPSKIARVELTAP